jgi:hypothetical protein
MLEIRPKTLLGFRRRFAPGWSKSSEHDRRATRREKSPGDFAQSTRAEEALDGKSEPGVHVDETGRDVLSPESPEGEVESR